MPVQFFKDPSVKDEEVPEDKPLEGDGVSGPDPLDLEADDWQDPDYAPDFEEEVAHEGFQKDSGDAEPSEEKDELEEGVKELTKPLELRTLCMVQPLLSRKGPEVLRAVRQFKVQLLTPASSPLSFKPGLGRAIRVFITPDPVGQSQQATRQQR